MTFYFTYTPVSEMTAFLAGFVAEKYVKIPFIAQLLGMATSYVVETTLDFVIDVWMDEISYMELKRERARIQLRSAPLAKLSCAA